MPPRVDSAFLIRQALFFVEMLLKVITMGFVSGRRAYLRDPWNVLDFFLVLVSLLVLLSSWVPALHALRPLRLIRMLRPLRLISRNQGMKLIVTSLVKVKRCGACCCLVQWAGHTREMCS